MQAVYTIMRKLKESNKKVFVILAAVVVICLVALICFAARDIPAPTSTVTKIIEHEALK